jgi:hypothetical protein
VSFRAPVEGSRSSVTRLSALFTARCAPHVSCTCAGHGCGARDHDPKNESDVELTVGGSGVKLTNLDKLFWRDARITKRDLLQYYADVAPALLPHLRDRAMVMKRYPNGATGKCFFMKRVPSRIRRGSRPVRSRTSRGT